MHVFVYGSFHYFALKAIKKMKNGWSFPTFFCFLSSNGYNNTNISAHGSSAFFYLEGYLAKEGYTWLGILTNLTPGFVHLLRNSLAIRTTFFPSFH